MPTDNVDALVIFGATGDLAKIETFPALVGLVDRGVLTVPIVGVAKSGWGLPQFREYAAASLRLNNMDPASPAAVRMLGLLRYVDGDLDDPATYQAMSAAMGDGERPLVLPRGAAVALRPDRRGDRGGRPGRGRAGDGGEAVRHRPGQRHEAQRHHAHSTSGGGRSTGSTTGSGSSRWRTCCSSGSPTPSWSRCSAVITWRASRSRWPRRSTSPTAAASTTRPARSAT